MIDEKAVEEENSKPAFEQKIRNDWAIFTRFCIKNNLTVSTMESCTGGQIASLITDTDGASAVLKGAFVTYCDDAKILQGVKKAAIEKYGVYSKETVLEMAECCRKTYKADIGIGTSGIMTTGEEGKVFFAVVTKDESIARKLTIPPDRNRLFYKMSTAQAVLTAFKSLKIYKCKKSD